MRTLGIMLIITLTMALGVTVLDAASHETGLSASKDAAEIEKLVKDLGSNVFAVRNNAQKRLGEMPYTLPILRRFLNDNDLDRRVRVAELVRQLTQQQFKKTLATLTRQGGEAPLDLLTDLVVEHRDRMDDEDWKSVNETLNAIVKRILAESKIRLSKGPRANHFPDPMKFLAYPLVYGELASSHDRLGTRRIVGDLSPRGDLVGSQVVTRGSINCEAWLGCLVMANGSISAQSGVLMGNCVVFTDGNINFSSVSGSIVIARGRVTIPNIRQIQETVVIERAADSSRVTLFSLSHVGLTLLGENEGLRVEKVAPNSAAAKSGFVAGDLLILEHNCLEQLTQAVRKCIAKQEELVLRVCRGSQQYEIALSFLEL